ncbi:MAG: CopG family transcriptional regulator [Clostridia bacterium]|nr:CopG family transcriptional regulator [Clostridia bacterium]
MKIGVIGIVIEKDRTIAEKVNKLLSEYGDMICGRMGLPDKENGVFVISVIVKSANEQISALTGKLGRLENVKVRSAVTECDVG